MGPTLLMFEELPEWDDLEVRVVIEVEGDSVEGRAKGNLTQQTRLDIVALASLDAAERAAGRPLGDLAGVSLGEVNGHSYVVVVVATRESGDPLLGVAPWRHFEDQAQAVIRAVFDSVDPRLSSPNGT